MKMFVSQVESNASFLFCLVLRKQIKFWLIVAIIIISKEKKIHASVIFNGPYLEIQ